MPTIEDAVSTVAPASQNNDSNEAVITGNEPLVELELELIQSHTAQKPVLRDEVMCAWVAVRSVSREEV